MIRLDAEEIRNDADHEILGFMSHFKRIKSTGRLG
jgi:hypothetical protein